MNFVERRGFRKLKDAGDVRRSVADRASSYSRVVDEGKVV